MGGTIVETADLEGSAANAGPASCEERMPGIEPELLATEQWLDCVLSTREADLRAHRVALTYSKFAELLDEHIHGARLRQRLAEQESRKTATADDARADPTVEEYGGDTGTSVGARAERKSADKPCYSNANWFNFATWGTVTLSRNIAHQRAPQRVDEFLPLPLRRRLTPAILRERAASGQRVSRALAWGQRQIFLTSTFAFLDFLEFIESPARDTMDLVHTKAAVARYSSVNDPAPIGTNRHLKHLRHAYEWYRKARTLGDAARARFVLGANVLLTAMEQDLADRAVRTVIDHVPQRVLSRFDRRVAQAAENWTAVPRQLVELQLPFRYVELRNVVQTAWSRLMTDQILVLALPTETLRIGRDIPWLDPARPYYPWPLRRPEAWTQEREVGNVVRSFDRTRGNGAGSAAQDWRRFDDRMNWAVTLMRSRQQDPTLFWPPYSREDECRIFDGSLPFRAGDPSELEVQAPLQSARDVPLFEFFEDRP
jgi:hypothetical protein